MTIAMAELLWFSAIFLEAGSFRSKIDLGMDRLLATNNGICFGKGYKHKPTYNKFLDGIKTT
jgi:hypothetical protein